MSSLQIPLKDLVDEMKGRLSTNGYDVLVAYSEAKVNELFHAGSPSQSGQVAKTVEFTHEGRDRLGTYKRKVHLELKNPTLKFEHGNKTEVHLMFNVASGYTQYEGSKDKDNLPSGLIIDLAAALHNVSGKVDKKGKFTATTGAGGHPVDAQPPGHDSALEAADDAARAVCINMSSAHVSVDVVSGADQPARDAADDLSSLKTYIENQFKEESGSVNWYLAGASKTYTPEIGAHLLRPKSFNFSICTGTGGEPALCMWISVVDGLNNGSDNVGFQPGPNPRSPIPTGSTASIIIHHQLLWKLFLEPNLKQLHPVTAEIVDNGGASAYKAKCLLDLPDYYQPEENSHGYDYPLFVQRHRDAIQFSTKPQNKSTQNATMTMSRGMQRAGADTAVVEYESPVQTVKWHRETNIPSGVEGTAYLTYTWAMRGRWTNTTTDTDKAHPNTISMEWTSDKKWSMTGTAEARSWTGSSMGSWGAGWGSFNGFISGDTAEVSIPDLYKIPDGVQVPQVNMAKWDSLDYFLTTNLIRPGELMFMAHPISESEEKGLALPNDLILTGDIIGSA